VVVVVQVAQQAVQVALARRALVMPQAVAVAVLGGLLLALAAMGLTVLPVSTLGKEQI
jgi:hypothetical protein